MSASKAQRPSYDDDFDSEVDDDDDAEDVQVKQVNAGNKNGANKNHNKMKDGKDSDDSEEDSDFEDPDEIEVPGGGKDLDTMLKVTGKPSKKKNVPNAGASLLKRKAAEPINLGGMTKSAAAALMAKLASAPKAASSNEGGDGDIEVVGIVPAQGSTKNRPQISLMKPNSASKVNMPASASSALARAAARQMAGQPLDDVNSSLYSALGDSNSSYNSLMASAAARDPYYQALLASGLGATSGNSSSAGGSNTVDLLQKSMQNGGLSSYVSNPYSLLSGNRLLPTTTNSQSSNATNNTNTASVRNNAFGGLNKNQISELWGLGGAGSLYKPNNVNLSSPNMLPTSGSRLGMSMNGPYSGAFGGLMPSSGFPRGLGESNLEDEEIAAEDEEDMGVIETYSNYMPSKLKIGKPHPDPVVETASLASVEPPDVWYTTSLPEDIIEERKLSALQLEAVTYAAQQHEQMLADGNRAGFLIGDGAGVGKGRTISGIIYDNYLKGRKRAIWVSVSNDLKYDAERDLKDIGADHVDVHFLSKMKYAKINSSINGNIKKGVMYATYSALIGESQGAASKGSKYKTRLKQLLNWCGEDFDGPIIFDECHRAKNLCPTGAGKPTKTGQTVLELQKRLPNARIVYASATGASEPKHMAYMVRLGIWGRGSPFNDFSDFLSAIEKRGVGAMEIVAMDMKLRGMYIARQLSFAGVSFRIAEVELPEDLRSVYNKSVDLWVELMHRFEEASLLVEADKRVRKTMWGQFWSAHQRFFKYLCIASKVPYVVGVANDVQKEGKCVVIGLQSTGEARTIEVVEREEELTDFVSTAKGVMQSLVEKHFPAPDRNKINRLLGINPSQERKSIFEELNIDLNNGSSSSGISGTLGKRKANREASTRVKKKTKYDWDDGEGLSDEDEKRTKDSDYEDAGEHESEDDEAWDMEENEDSDDYNPFGDESDEDDPWAKREKKANKKKGKKKKGKNGALKNGKNGLSSHSSKLDTKEDSDDDCQIINPFSSALSATVTATNGVKLETPQNNPSEDKVDRACQMREAILKKVDALGATLPPNTLDQLIDELGGPECVSEMTGRKGRVVQDDKSGEVRYESRSVGNDATLETLNLHEKDMFMNGFKDVAIISEAASSGISLQADRRVKNQKRRVHMTLELPWSADRAIQQFGRTHRSNQTSAPEYVLLISDLAGEHRFASIVAKRLESLGALTHGDRRAGESRDLSRFNIDNKYGRAALEAVFKAIMGYEAPVVKPPAEYKGDFFKDIADGLVGVGLITQSEDMPGMLQLDKGHNDMSKFLNRILGMKVERQNLLFRYFADTLNAIINQAKRSGKYDQGILDVGLTDEDMVELVKTHTFIRKHATGKAKIELHVLTVERGLSWEAAKEKWEDLVGNPSEEGFYISHQVRNGKSTAILAAATEKSSRYKALAEKGSKKKDKTFIVYRPNTGQQVKQETLSELRKKYKKVSADEAEPHWNEQFKTSAKRCSHAYWRGNCKTKNLGMPCEVGLRKKTYNVLAGSVLTVWNQVEAVLTHDGNRRGANTKMQVVRLKLQDGKRIVGTLIPSSAMTSLLTALMEGSEGSEAIETIH